MVKVNNFSYGSIVIDNKKYSRDVAIFPDGKVDQRQGGIWMFGSHNIKYQEIESLLKGKPEVVIIATGAKPFIPDIPGVKGENVITAIEALTGTKKVGDKVVIIGGGLIGCETAEFLADKGKKTTILVRRERIANDVGRASRWVLVQRVRNAGIGIETDLLVEEITKDGVRGSRNGGPEFFPADTVVLARGFLPDKELAAKLQDKVPVIHLIGDCAEPRMIKEAIEEGFRIGSEV